MPQIKKLSTLLKNKHIDVENQLVIQKTNPLLTLSETSLTLAELKILDAYLSKINSHEPEKRLVKLEKGQIEDLLGVTQIKQPDLEKRIENMFQIITIRDERKSKGFTKITLFEKAVCYQDEDNLWQVELSASQSAMEYIFFPENLGYLRYRLSNVVGLTSRYSYILYLYLEQQKFRTMWEISLEELKQILRCNANTYNQFKRFNDLILKKCFKELNEKTDCKCQYKPVKSGRKVIGIQFILNRTEENIFHATDWEEEPDDQISFLQSACFVSGINKPEFSRVEMQQILEVLSVIPKSKLPTDVPTGEIEFRWFHYLAYQYTNMNRIAEKSHIKNRFLYFLTMIKKDAGIL